MVIFLHMWYTFGVNMIKIEFSLKREYFQKNLGKSLDCGDTPPPWVVPRTHCLPLGGATTRP